MTTQDTIVVEENTTEETPENTKKFNLKPIAKKALIWGGAAVGIIVGAVLLGSAARRGEFEDDTIVIEEIPNGFTVTDATPEVTND